MSPPYPLIRIDPRAGCAGHELRELWQYRELLGFLIWRDIKVRYKQTATGVAWATRPPLVPMVLVTGIVGGLANFTLGFLRSSHRLFGTPHGDTFTQENWAIEEYAPLGLTKAQTDFNDGPIWKEVKSSPDFWATLDPINPSAMARINRIQNKIFITDRPGINTKEQSAYFLQSWGIEDPIVIVGSKKGPIAAEQHVTAVIDDRYSNVIDILGACPNVFAGLLYCPYNKMYHEEWVNRYGGSVVLSVDHFIDTCYSRGLVVDKPEEDVSALEQIIRDEIAAASAV